MVEFDLSCGHVTHTGLVRKQNEDNYGALAERGVFALADGMGGHHAGEFASAIAVTSMMKALNARQSPEKAILQAQEDVHAFSEQAGPREGRMGATAIALRFKDAQRFEAAWVGDSRIYKSGIDGVHALTRDHSFAEELVRVGKLTPAEALEHPKRGVLTRAVGMERKDPAEPFVETLQGELRPGERLLICSDGLHGCVSDVRLAALLEEQGSEEQTVDHSVAQDRADKLLQAAFEGGAHDNVSIIVIERSRRAALLAPAEDTESLTAESAAGAETVPDLAAASANAESQGLPWLPIIGGVAAAALAAVVLFSFLQSDDTGSASAVAGVSVADTSEPSEASDAPMRSSGDTSNRTQPMTQSVATQEAAPAVVSPSRISSADEAQTRAEPLEKFVQADPIPGFEPEQARQEPQTALPVAVVAPQSEPVSIPQPAIAQELLASANTTAPRTRGATRSSSSDVSASDSGVTSAAQVQDTRIQLALDRLLAPGTYFQVGVFNDSGEASVSVAELDRLAWPSRVIAVGSKQVVVTGPWDSAEEADFVEAALESASWQPVLVRREIR